MVKTKTPRASAEVKADLDEANAKRVAAVAAARELAVEYDEAVAYEEAQAALAGMTDTQRAALAQVIKTDGVASSATVGEVG